MSVVNGKSLLAAAPLDPMLDHKARAHGTSYGLAEAGFDIRVKQDIRFEPPNSLGVIELAHSRNRKRPDVQQMICEAFHGYVEVDGQRTLGRFCLASSIERFDMPADMVAIIGHKSSWARRGVNVWAGTTAEAGWKGHLTLEIGFHGNEPVHIPAGSGIAQVLFHRLENPAEYRGRYQGQPDRPVAAIPATEGGPL